MLKDAEHNMKQIKLTQGIYHTAPGGQRVTDGSINDDDPVYKSQQEAG